MRIGVDLLRWLLAIGNVTLLTLVVMVAAKFFALQDEEKGLVKKLAPVESVKVEKPKTNARANPELIRNLQLKPPPPKPKPKPKPEKTDLPPPVGPEEGGPLDDKFELLSVIVSDRESQSIAFLQEKSQEQAGIRSTPGSSRSRSSARRGSSRSRTSARGKAPTGPLQKILSVGQVYDGYEIVGIYDSPARVKYAQGIDRARREYFLYKEVPEVRFIYDEETGELDGLRGLTDEEIKAEAEGALSAAMPSSSRNRRSSSRTPAGGKRTLSQVNEEIDPERRGSIGDGKEDVNNAVNDNAAREQNQRDRAARKNNKDNNKARGNKANQRGNNNRNNNNRTNNTNRREAPRSEAPNNRSRSGGTSARATKGTTQRQPGSALAGQRQPGPRNDAEKNEMARIQEMTDEEREAYEEEQQRMAEEDQERDN